ncbi:MAG: response regulator transcription factor [Burkholderiaceae bacterium]|nr:response regulator transcription factor [Burkholderiaceae bacterium]
MNGANQNITPQAGQADTPVWQGLKLLIADDHHLVRDGLKLAVRQLDEAVEIVEADTLAKAIEAYKANPAFDLVLLDLNMPGTSGLMALDGFEEHCPDARVVVISSSYDMQTVQTAVRRGVLGFIPKMSGKGTLLSALRFILAGGVYVPPEMFLGEQSQVLRIQPQPVIQTAMQDTPQSMGLTLRQVDVLRQLVEGKSNKVICREMNLAMGTVKGHVAAILHALDVNSRAEAIAAADRLGWRAMLRATAASRQAEPGNG